MRPTSTWASPGWRRGVQWHFYRQPVYPAPVMAELSTTITDPAGVTLKQGWNGFAQQWTGSWSGRMFKYMILRTDGTHEQGPSADEQVTGWRGTLQPGDCIIFPEVSEGMYLLDGRVDVVIESTPSKKWFRLYLGRFDTPTLPHGARTCARVLNLKFRGIGPLVDIVRLLALESGVSETQ